MDNNGTRFRVYVSREDVRIFRMTSKKILNNLKNNYLQYFILFFYVFRMTVIIMDNNGNKFSMTHTLVIARKSKIFVAIQKIHVWLWITSSLRSS